jgi:leucyl aminopeptidase
MSGGSDRRGFFARLFSRKDEGENTAVFSREEIGELEAPEEEPLGGSQSFTVERAAEVIEDLPPDVPRESAVRIVRHTLTAAGISIDDLGRSVRRREARLGSEIELAQSRQKEYREKTEEVVRSLEEQIQKAREAQDSGVSGEEEKISRARSGLERVALVREFFDLPSEEPQPETPEEPAGDDTQSMRRPETDDTQVIYREGPLSEGHDRRESRDGPDL